MNKKLLSNYTGKVTNLQDKVKDDELDRAIKQNQTLYSRRLQKSKIKDLEREMQAEGRGGDRNKLQRL